MSVFARPFEDIQGYDRSQEDASKFHDDDAKGVLDQ
jgi:hypothetical protein